MHNYFVAMYSLDGVELPRRHGCLRLSVGFTARRSRDCEILCELT
jgi:hypothetical protein